MDHLMMPCRMQNAVTLVKKEGFLRVYPVQKRWQSIFCNLLIALF
jgi:hypothetical protein